ncbi:MAG TPA: host attachment protein [Gemmatimonadales bacterium]|nr:host attachment protein [Gemmatimonadales bacterium]
MLAETVPAVGSRRAKEPLLAVVLDHAHARFFEVTDTGATELTGLRSPRMRGGKFHSDRQGGPGWGEKEFHQRRREEERRHYRAIARRLAMLDRSRGARGFVVAGPGRAATAFRRSLPPPLAERVLSTARLNPLEVSPVAVHFATRAARRAAQLAREQALVAAVIEGVGRGVAAIGIREVLAALERRQVRTLLVARDFARQGYRCAASNRLVLGKAECVEGGGVIREPDIVAAAVAEGRRQDADVVVVGDSRLAERIDKIAALLRYPV